MSPHLPLSLRQRLLLRLVNFYPPFWGAGIRVVSVAPDWTTVRVVMPLTGLNRNFVGTHFGGSLYAMCDPFFMLMLMQQLGPGYVVWDKAATIHFLRPGRGTVTATFHLPPETVAAIRAQADSGEKIEPLFSADVLDEAGQSVARVEKRLYVRRKAQTPLGQASPEQPAKRE